LQGAQGFYKGYSMCFKRSRSNGTPAQFI